MASFNFSPIVDAISLINTTNEQNVISTSRLESLLPAEQAALLVCPFAVPEKMVPFLTTKGVPYSNAANKPNPHPVHKNLERYLLQSMKHYINEPATIISMKREKYMKIARACADKQVPVQLTNPIITAKDAYRYGDSTPSSFGQIRNLTTPVVFIHDALHYLTRSDMDQFLMRNPAVHTVLATLFCPVELLENQRTNSIEPGLYTLSYPEPEYFMYTPEGDSPGAYIQETSKSLDWLRTFEYEGANHYYVHHLDRMYAQHLMVITKRRYLEEKHRSFIFPRYTSLTDYFDPKYYTFSQNFIEREILQKAILYVLGQPKAKNADLNATMQVQLSKTGSQSGLDALLHCVSIANNVRKYQVEPYLLRDAYIKLGDRSRFWRDIPNWFLSYFDQRRQNLASKIALRPYSITIRAADYKVSPLRYNGNDRDYCPSFRLLEQIKKTIGLSVSEIMADPYQLGHQQHVKTILEHVNEFFAYNGEKLKRGGEYNYLAGLKIAYGKNAKYVGKFSITQFDFTIPASQLEALLDLPRSLLIELQILTGLSAVYDPESARETLEIFTYKPSEKQYQADFLEKLEKDDEVTPEDKNFIRNLPTSTDMVHQHPLKVLAPNIYSKLMNTPTTTKPMPPEGNCLLDALAKALKVPTSYMWHVLQAYHRKERRKYTLHEYGMSYAYEGFIIAQELGFALYVSRDDEWERVYSSGFMEFFIQLGLQEEHFTCELELTRIPEGT